MWTVGDGASGCETVVCGSSEAWSLCVRLGAISAREQITAYRRVPW